MNIIDLFAGCGGFSLGFEMAGFSSLLALEKDAWASETYAFNHPGTRVLTADITAVDPAALDLPPEAVDGIVGGPPCQGFSLSGPRDPRDPRNSLFSDFVRFVRFFQPRFFVMENVPGLLSMKTREGMPVKGIILREFSASGYKVFHTELNAADFGVPQSRHRIFFIGIRKGLPFDFELLVPRPVTDAPVTLKDAISDLPAVAPGDDRETHAYDAEPDNDYQRLMREGSDLVRNHVAMRHTRRLVARFAAIRHGQSVSDVSEEHAQRKRGDASRISGKSYGQNNFKPFPDRPCPTIPATFQSNFVHPWQNRNFTAREGARLQSFPDRYVFRGRRTTMSWEKNLSQYQQIGNAVPPLLARALALTIRAYLDGIEHVRDRPSPTSCRTRKSLFDAV